jgi:hypothetical protein
MKKRLYRDPISGEWTEERRSGTDRRDAMPFSRLFARRPLRRKSRGRRKTDPGCYVDRYDCQSWVVSISVLILSLVDAVLTRMHLVQGTAIEANPIMRELIDHGGFPLFYVAKATMTFFPVVVILIHKEWPLGRFAAQLCLLAYILLTGYHLILLFITR